MNIRRPTSNGRRRSLVFSLFYLLVILLLILPERYAVTYATPTLPGAQSQLEDDLPFTTIRVQTEEKRDPFTFNSVDLELLEQSALFEERLEKNGLVYNDEKLNKYLDQVGQTLVAVGPPLERVRWRFRVLRDPFANALALPNGSIYITVGLLALLENESQLAGVLAHEITHVIERHTFIQYRSMRKKIVAINLLKIAATWSPIFGAASNAIYLLANTAEAVLFVTMSGYNSKLEKEADIYALKRLSESNYDPKELVRAFRLLQTEYDAELIPLYYSDHPKLQDRINYINRLLSDTLPKPYSREVRAVNRIRYLSQTEGVARHDVQLNLDEGRFRTALAMSQKLVNFNPESSENIVCLAEAYRSLGPRPIELSGEELTQKGREKAQKQKQRSTPDEEESLLMSTAIGQAAWKTNQANAAELYRKALELNRKNAVAHRGYGFLLEKTQQYQEALEHYKEYLKLVPDALDRTRIQRRVENLEKIKMNVPAS